MTPLSALSMSQMYLVTAGELSKMIVRSKNRSALAARKKLSVAEINRRLKRSDSNLAGPLLFNFYHGLELTIKGHLLGQGRTKIKSHNLIVLLEALQRNTNIDPLIDELSKWIPPPDQSPIGKFLTNNDITIDDWFQALKYSSLTGGKQINHFDLKYGGSNTLWFWRNLSKSCTEIIRKSVSASRDNEYEGMTPRRK
jgi:hypothetical protein